MDTVRVEQVIFLDSWFAWSYFDPVTVAHAFIRLEEDRNDEEQVLGATTGPPTHAGAHLSGNDITGCHLQCP